MTGVNIEGWDVLKPLLLGPAFALAETLVDERAITSTNIKETFFMD